MFLSDYDIDLERFRPDVEFDAKHQNYTLIDICSIRNIQLACHECDGESHSSTREASPAVAGLE